MLIINTWSCTLLAVSSSAEIASAFYRLFLSPLARALVHCRLIEQMIPIFLLHDSYVYIILTIQYDSIELRSIGKQKNSSTCPSGCLWDIALGVSGALFAFYNIPFLDVLLLGLAS